MEQPRLIGIELSRSLTNLQSFKKKKKTCCFDMRGDRDAQGVGLGLMMRDASKVGCNTVRSCQGIAIVTSGASGAP